MASSAELGSACLGRVFLGAALGTFVVVDFLSPDGFGGTSFLGFFFTDVCLLFCLSLSTL